MSRRGVIIIAVTVVVLFAATVVYLLLPKNYEVQQQILQSVVLWNDKEAFLFLTTTSTGRASNVVQNKALTSNYGVLLC